MFWIPLPKIELEKVSETWKQCVVNLSTNEDAVNHPPHYTSGKIECIDAIEAATEGLNGFEGYCAGNVIKYIWRWKKKGGVEDLKKAQWYLEKLVQTFEGDDDHGSKDKSKN